MEPVTQPLSLLNPESAWQVSGDLFFLAPRGMNGLTTRLNIGVLQNVFHHRNWMAKDRDVRGY